ncbi:MAG: class I SAM-dependent methyltransferase [Caldisericaceae bacterium]
MVTDKIHYYDGFFYRKFVDPNLQSVRNTIGNLVLASTSVIDIGCGTGSLVFELASKCSKVVGLDASSKMIDFANTRSSMEQLRNVSFVHGGLEYLASVNDLEFDYAIFSMSLHEMPHGERQAVLKEAIRISKSVILADYFVPQNSFYSTLSVLLIEFIAGFNHFKGYLDFRKSNGLDSLISLNNLKVVSESIDRSNSIRIVHTLRSEKSIP